MAFQAQCMFCGQRLKVPDHALGTSGRCPKCNNFFTLVPAEEAVVPDKGGPYGRVFSRPGTPRAPTGQAVPEPGQTSATVPAKVPPLIESCKEEGQQAIPWIEPIGLCALLLAGGALLCASSLALAKLVIWLSLLATLAGLVSLLRVLAIGRFRLLFPIAGVVGGGAVFLIALCAPSFLGPVYLAAREQEMLDPTAIRIVPLTGKQGVPLSDADWIDASQASLQQGRVRVQVMKVWPDAKSKKDSAEVLFIRLRIHGLDATASARDQSDFLKDIAGFKLADNTGKVYRQQDIRQARPDATGRKVFPAALVEQDRAFEVPSATVPYLRLEMPAPGGGVFRFQIPGAMMRRSHPASLADRP